MEKEKIKLRIPSGYRVLEKSKTVGLKRAYEILKTKKQRHFTKAVRIGESAVLYWHSFRCPHCGKELPAYPHYSFSNIAAAQRKSDNILSSWTMMQMPLFSEPDDTLFFQAPIDGDREFTCGRCGETSRVSTEEKEITVGHDETSVYISREIRSLKEMVELKWPSALSIPSSIHICEKIVFNFETGETILSLLAGNTVLESLSITEADKDFGYLAELISKNRVVKRALKNQFCLFLSNPFPYPRRETTLQKLALITRFTDFPREFYDAIPLCENSVDIDESFLPIARDLRSASSALKAFSKSSLPQKKSVRRLFLEKPGFFFYIKECKELFDILGDINLFCRLLNGQNAYKLLSGLHLYPSIFEFYRDYSKIKGERSLVRILENNLTQSVSLAFRYCMMSSFGKETQQKRWQTCKRVVERESAFFDIDETEFSTPMHAVPENIPNTTVGRYYFKWLTTKNEYKEAGTVLDNCLTVWSNRDNPVTVVYKGQKIIAAIEVDDNCIRQVRRIHNLPIEANSKLHSAVEKWCERHSLIMCETE